MKTSFENNTLTFYFSERIDSTNAPALSDEVLNTCKQHPGCRAVVDASDLEYISSAGLRILMRLHKLTGNLVVENVNDDIYDVLDMTGFVEIFQVKKALRRISIDGCEIVGNGRTGTAYRLNDEVIVKVYHPTISPNMIDNDRKYSYIASSIGVPAVISFERVLVGDRQGVLYSMPGADTLLHRIVTEPDRCKEYAEQLAGLLKDISSKPLKLDNWTMKSYILTDSLPMQTEKGLWTAEQAERIRAFIGRIPDVGTFSHGNFHPGIVLCQNGKLMMYAMSTICAEHVIFDLAACAANSVVWGAIFGAESLQKNFNTPLPLATRFWNDFLNAFFADRDAAFIADVDRQIRALAAIRIGNGLRVNSFSEAECDRLRGIALAGIDGKIQF